MTSIRKTFLTMLAVCLGLGLGAADAEAQPCPMVVLADTTLAGDLICQPGYSGPAVDIQASGVTFDGGGFKIIVGNDGSGYGVQTFNVDDVVVQNVHIEFARIGVFFSNANNLTVKDSLITSVPPTPAYVTRVTRGFQGGGSNGVTISNTTVNAQESPLSVSTMSGAVFEDSVFHSIGWYSILINFNDATLARNTFSSDAVYGVQVTGSRNTINANTFGPYSDIGL